MKRALTIAGSDSGGGAGIQADLRTFAALGVRGVSAITAVTAQNAGEWRSMHLVPAANVVDQIEAVIDGVDAVKIGMLFSAETIVAVARVLPRGIPIVVDPVMVAKTGGLLLAPEALSVFREEILPLATLLTPNLPEAEILLGMKIETVGDMRAAGHRLRERGAVLMKGGHMAGPVCTDVLIGPSEMEWTEPRRSGTVRGTGCALASAIAAFLALDYSLEMAVRFGREYLLQSVLPRLDTSNVWRDQS